MLLCPSLNFSALPVRLILMGTNGLKRGFKELLGFAKCPVQDIEHILIDVAVLLFLTEVTAERKYVSFVNGSNSCSLSDGIYVIFPIASKCPFVQMREDQDRLVTVAFDVVDKHLQAIGDISILQMAFLYEE